jgi:hypothetical protein
MAVQGAGAFAYRKPIRQWIRHRPAAPDARFGADSPRFDRIGWRPIGLAAVQRQAKLHNLPWRMCPGTARHSRSFLGK